jgi:hypothetical protein
MIIIPLNLGSVINQQRNPFSFKLVILIFPPPDSHGSREADWKVYPFS